MLNFTLRPLYLQGNSHQYPWDRRLGGSYRKSLVKTERGGSLGTTTLWDLARYESHTRTRLNVSLPIQPPSLSLTLPHLFLCIRSPISAFLPLQRRLIASRTKHPPSVRPPPHPRRRAAPHQQHPNPVISESSSSPACLRLWSRNHSAVQCWLNHISTEIHF
jgi:hypothetical protein